MSTIPGPSALASENRLGKKISLMSELVPMVLLAWVSWTFYVHVWDKETLGGDHPEHFVINHVVLLNFIWLLPARVLLYSGSILVFGIEAMIRSSVN